MCMSLTCLWNVNIRNSKSNEVTLCTLNGSFESFPSHVGKLEIVWNCYQGVVAGQGGVCHFCLLVSSNIVSSGVYTLVGAAQRQLSFM